MADKLQILNHVRINVNSQDEVFERLCSQGIYTAADRNRFNVNLYAAPPANCQCTPDQDVIIAAGGSCYDWHATKKNSMAGFCAIVTAGIAALVISKGCATDSNIHTRQARDMVYTLEDTANDEANRKHVRLTGQPSPMYGPVLRERAQRDASRAYERLPEEEKPQQEKPEGQTNQDYLLKIAKLALATGIAAAGLTYLVKR